MPKFVSWSAESRPQKKPDSADAELELSKLERQYRITMGDRAALYNVIINKKKKQEAEIHQLQNEFTLLMKDLNISESRSNRERDDVIRNKLIELKTKHRHYEEMIEGAQDHIDEINSTIKAMDACVLDINKKLASMTTDEQQVQAQKHIRVLEDRLNQALTRFNRLLTENSSLREQIDHLINARARLEGMYKKLERDKVQLNKDISETTEQANQAYSLRYEAQGKMKVLNEKTEKDYVQHMVEMKDLQRVIDHDKNLKQFQKIKNQERTEDEAVVERRKRKEEEEAARKQRDVDGQCLEEYLMVFAELKKLTGEGDLDRMVNKFIEVEETNFALFNYINEQNAAIENLQDEIKTRQDEIDSLSQSEVVLEGDRFEMLAELEAKLQVATRSSDENETNLTMNRKVLDQLMHGIAELFEGTGCDRAPIDEILGGCDDMDAKNIMMYLGIIEQKANQLLQVHTYMMMKENEKVPDPITLDALHSATPHSQNSHMHVTAPSTTEDSDDDGWGQPEIDITPLTHADIRSQVIQRINTANKK